ncbi:MAG: hypothetical protein KJ574_02555 [Nanoarchaeota archaeon]|nr:hypothetical protein [Nanoarchaeota archaeon]
MNTSQKRFNKVVTDIKSLKIQGAKNVAIEATKSLKYILDISNSLTKQALIKNLNEARKLLFATRPTEPGMRNSVSFALSRIDQLPTKEAIIRDVEQNINQALDYFDEAEKRIVEIGKKKIRDDSIICTHCHSSTVIKILIQAHKEGKRFEVHNTETRPFFQGRITAKELSDQGIKVVHYVDAAVRMSLKKADLFLIGADAITSEGKVINKIGSELFAEVANKYGVPVYSCAHAWKLDPKTAWGFEEEIEMRQAKEIWAKPPKNVKIYNYAFEQVSPAMISGIISELGIYQPLTFIEEVRRAYPWMFNR